MTRQLEYKNQLCVVDVIYALSDKVRGEWQVGYQDKRLKMQWEFLLCEEHRDHDLTLSECLLADMFPRRAFYWSPLLDLFEESTPNNTKEASHGDTLR